jgi:formate-dependent nitrite reductase cytochrome c552 subunit
VGFDPRAHAFAVVEAVNRARTNPPEYGDALAASLTGCYSGQTFSPPWGGRLKTEEGEAQPARAAAVLTPTLLELLRH